MQVFALGDAQAAAPGLVVGFLDQFLTTLVAANVEDPVTKFVLAGLSVSQIIFLSNIGVMLLNSRLPIGMAGLVGIFVVRTALAFPLLVFFGNLVMA